MPINQESIVIGLVTGLLVPLASNIMPIKQALGTSLRDALDRFRAGVDDTEVEFIRMENAGVTPSQVMLSLVILANSYLTLYLIPNNIMQVDVGGAFFNVNFLLIGVVIGFIFLGQALAKPLSEMYLEIIMMIMPQDMTMQPLIKKNLEPQPQKHESQPHVQRHCLLPRLPGH